MMLFSLFVCFGFFFFNQKTAYELRISDWSSDVCSSDLVLYRDGLLLVIDKPAGLAGHGGPGGGDNLERYFHHLQFGLPKPPSLAHRLDRDTSGCLVLGRHPKALRRLGKLFQEGRAEKVYSAVTRDAPAAEAGRIEMALKIGRASCTARECHNV